MMDPRLEDCDRSEECKGGPSAPSAKSHQTCTDSSTNCLAEGPPRGTGNSESTIRFSHDHTSKDDVVLKSESPSFEPMPTTSSTRSQPFSWDETPPHNKRNGDKQHRRPTERDQTRTIISIRFTRMTYRGIDVQEDSNE